MDVIQEGVNLVFQEDKLVAMVRRDEKSKKHLVYLVKEATSIDIVDLLKGGELKIPKQK